MADIDENSMELRVRRKVAKQLYEALHEQPDQPPMVFGDTHDDPQAKKKGLKHKPQSPYTIQNILWLVASIGVFYWTDFARVAVYDSRIRPTWFLVGVVLVAVNLAIATFLIVYLSAVKKLDSDDWERLYPSAIPIATACFAFGSFCLTVAFWPVWSVFTIPILFTQFMGVVIVIAMFK